MKIQFKRLTYTNTIFSLKINFINEIYCRINEHSKFKFIDDSFFKLNKLVTYDSESDFFNLNTSFLQSGNYIISLKAKEGITRSMLEVVK